jgi:hypothetical protein
MRDFLRHALRIARIVAGCYAKQHDNAALYTARGLFVNGDMRLQDALNNGSQRKRGAETVIA